MAENLARKLIADHLVEGDITPGSEIALRIDQILTHDANGPYPVHNTPRLSKPSSGAQARFCGYGARTSRWCRLDITLIDILMTHFGSTMMYTCGLR